MLVVISRAFSVTYLSLRSGVQAVLSLVFAVAARLDYGFSLLRSPWQITGAWPQQSPGFTGRVVLFAHHDRRGQVAGYVLRHLAALQQAGGQILFVSNAGKLDDGARAALESLCCAVLVRRNWGGKWGAWREALRYLGDAPAVSSLILADDSVYGPLVPVQPLLDAFEAAPCDVMGLTDSWQFRWHLQSYFLMVQPRVLCHPDWARFWGQCAPVRSASWLVRHGEAGFSQAMLRAGFRLEPVHGFHDLCASVDRSPLEGEPPEGRRGRLRYAQLELIDELIASHQPFDPAAMLWRQLLAAGHPYLSRPLVISNEQRVRDASDWPLTLADFEDWDLSLIADDIAGQARRGLLEDVRKGIKFLKKAWNAVVRHAGEALGVMVGHFRSHRQAVFVWPAHQVACGRRVVVFVHFDRNGAVRDYVLFYLQALRDAGVSILFVTNSGKLQPAAIEALKPLCVGIIVRRNVGYDFGAWREGLEYLKGSLDDLEWLALANDSVYGPLRPLQLAFNHLDFTKADVWGFTDSEQRGWHLQSYFLIFSRRVLRSTAWREFWQSVLPVTSKSWAITNCELKITQKLEAGGFKCAALFPYQKLLQQVPRVRSIGNLGATFFARLRLRQNQNLSYAISQKYTLNPTADLWRQLLRDDFPFLKRELLRSNPAKIPDSIDWQSEVAATSNADVRLIEEDLRKSVRDRLA